MRLTRTLSVTAAVLLAGTLLAPTAAAETKLPTTATLTLQLSQVSFGQSMRWQVNCRPGAVAAGVHWDAELESWAETNTSGQAAGTVTFDSSWSFGGANLLTVYAECQWATFPQRRQATKPVQLTLKTGSSTVKRATVWDPIYETVDPTTLVAKKKIAVGKKLAINNQFYGKKQQKKPVTIELTNKSHTYTLATIKPGKYQLRFVAPKDKIYYQSLTVKPKKK